MAAPLIPLLRQQFVNGVGAPYAGALLFSYAAGTTSKQNTYSDSTLATPNTNPVVADADGRFGAIYLDPSLVYKFVLSPSTDTDPPTGAVFTQDNVVTAQGQILTVLSKSAAYIVLVGDGEDIVLLADASTAAFTVTLYTAVGNGGRKIKIVKTDSSVNAVTVDPNWSQTINGLTTVALSDQYESLILVSDGTNWVSLSEPDWENESMWLASQVFGG